jgi:hypothetical protein
MVKVDGIDMRGRFYEFLPLVTVLKLHILERLLFVLVGDETKLPLQTELLRRQNRLLGGLERNSIRQWHQGCSMPVQPTYGMREL